MHGFLGKQQYAANAPGMLTTKFSKQLAPLIADKVQLKPEEPAHGTLAPLGDSLEDLVHMDSLVLAYPQRRAVNKTDARALAKKHLLDKQRQRNRHVVLQLYKTVI